MAKKIKPVSRVVRIETEINKIAGEIFLQRKEYVGLDESWVPCLDISEREDAIIIEVELPGVDQRDVSILLHSNRVEVKGVKSEHLSHSQIRYLRLEREYGSFRRLVYLPSVVIPDKGSASLENGILTILLSKHTAVKEKEIVLEIKKPKE